MTAETPGHFGRAADHVFKHLESKENRGEKLKIVIRKGTCFSGYSTLSMGVDVLFIGPRPTPGVGCTSF
ncbi:MAG: hypothetical protein P8L18_04885 [Verrucomicrobiota bacterium]|nr:hypothetical protein [Verrucomicrobiota bacterium]